MYSFSGGGIFEATDNEECVKCHVGEEAVLRVAVKEDTVINKDDVHLEW